VVATQRMNGRFAPEAAVGAETRPVLIAVGAVGQSPYRVQQIDPHGDSIHMGPKNRMKCRFAKAQTRPSISDGVLHANGFVRKFL
jgi:hypothetical protein